MVAICGPTVYLATVMPNLISTRFWTFIAGYAAQCLVFVGVIMLLNRCTDPQSAGASQPVESQESVDPNPEQNTDSLTHDSANVPDSSAHNTGDDSLKFRTDHISGIPDTSRADGRARYLAGLEARIVGADTVRLGLRDSLFWLQHAYRTNSAWKRFSRHQWQVSTWANENLVEPQAVKTVFYPFSGPDFAHVFTLFPHAESYTLVGLEPVGTLPALETYTPALQRKAFRRLTKALNSILSASFFITKDMDTVLRGQELRGTAPILQFFMVRTGCRVLGFELLRLSPEGNLVSPPAVGNEAIRIRFSAPDHSLRQLVYIQGNLNNYGLNHQNPGLQAYVKALPTGVTYLKSASYLLHSTNFSIIRSLILGQSSFILQDDSGLPFKYISSKDWQTRLFGNYIGTIKLFARRSQDDLQKAYKDSASLGRTYPLAFRLGYGQQRQINLQLAKRAKT